MRLPDATMTMMAAWAFLLTCSILALTVHPAQASGIPLFKTRVSNSVDFPCHLAERWQSSLAKRVLFPVAEDESKKGFVTGCRLEELLTNLTSIKYAGEVTLLQFKRGNAGNGPTAGTNAMAQSAEEEYREAGRTEIESSRSPLSMLAILVFFSLFAVQLLGHSKFLSAVACGMATTAIGTIILGYSLPLMSILVLTGVLAGLILAKLFRKKRSSKHRP